MTRKRDAVSELPCKARTLPPTRQALAAKLLGASLTMETMVETMVETVQKLEHVGTLHSQSWFHMWV